MYDSNVTAPDPFPFSPESGFEQSRSRSDYCSNNNGDGGLGNARCGMEDDGTVQRTFVRSEPEQWNRDRALERGSTSDLREAVAADPKLRVLIAHGWDDLSCPFMGSVLTVDEMPVMGDPKRVAVHEYPGGHMFYTRPGSQSQFLKDVKP